MIIYYDSGTRPLFREHFRKSGFPCTTIYRSGLAMKVDRLPFYRLRPRSMMYNLPECAPDDDKVICFDTYAGPGYMDFICRKYPGKRILLWFWNPVRSQKVLDEYPRRVELWSYSLRDCRRYHLRYNTPFYFDDLAWTAMQTPAAANDTPRVLFIGREKGRAAALEALETELRGAGAETEFHIMRNRESLIGAGKGEPLLPYDACVERVRASDALLDYSMDLEAGLSLRAMESLFWQKKLITNNRTILAADFYRPENVFLLGRESRSLADFLAAPYVPVERGIQERYLLSSWLRRFDVEVTP